MAPQHSFDQTPGDVLHDAGPAWSDTERASVSKRIERKRKFKADVAAYVVINALLVAVWAIGSGGSFWPGWVMLGWGVLLTLDLVDLYLRRPVTDADVERALRGRR
jgi:fatty acid desaturase